MKKIAFLIALLFFIVGLFVLPHYGQNWDESIHFYRGQAFLHFFLTGKKDYNDLPAFKKYFQKDDTIFFSPVDKKKSEISRRSVYQERAVGYSFFAKDTGHPPLSDILAASFNFVLFQKLGLINDVDSFHVYSLMLAAILVGVVFWWTAKYYGRFPALVAAIALSLYPLFLGESHFNIKDVPEMVFYSLTLLSFYEGVTRRSRLWIIISSVFLGFAFATKLNAVFIPFILGPWFVLYLLTKNDNKKDLLFTPIFALYPLLGFFIFYLSWPTLWAHPIKGFLDVIGYYKQIGTNSSFDSRYLTLFGINTYPVKWLLLTTPLITLFFSFWGTVYAFFKGFSEKRKTTILVLLWLIVPILRVSMPSAGVYGGVRHIMEFIPAMAILAGIGAATIVKQFNNLTIQQSIRIGILLLFLPILLKLISIHPNEGVYFNPIIGGLKGAAQRNIPEWGQNLGGVNKQGMVWLNRNAEKDSIVVTNFGLGSSIPDLFLRGDIHFSGRRSVLERKGEYVIALTHQSGFEETYLFRYLDTFLIPLYEVKVDNVPILKVFKNDYENTKQEYRDFTILSDKPKLTLTGENLFIDAGRSVRLAKMTIQFANKDCTKDEDGSVSISVDSNSWRRLDGDLRSQILLPGTTYQKDGSFLYYFAADKARYINIVFEDPEKSCFKNIQKIVIYGFEEGKN